MYDCADNSIANNAKASNAEVEFAEDVFELIQNKYAFMAYLNDTILAAKNCTINSATLSTTLNYCKLAIAMRSEDRNEINNLKIALLKAQLSANSTLSPQNIWKIHKLMIKKSRDDKAQRVLNEYKIVFSNFTTVDLCAANSVCFGRLVAAAWRLCPDVICFQSLISKNTIIGNTDVLRVCLSYIIATDNKEYAYNVFVRINCITDSSKATTQPDILLLMIKAIDKYKFYNVFNLNRIFKNMHDALYILLSDYILGESTDAYDFYETVVEYQSNMQNDILPVTNNTSYMNTINKFKTVMAALSGQDCVISN